MCCTFSIVCIECRWVCVNIYISSDVHWLLMVNVETIWTASSNSIPRTSQWHAWSGCPYQTITRSQLTAFSWHLSRTARESFSVWNIPSDCSVFSGQLLLYCICDMCITVIPFFSLQSLLIQVFIKKPPYAKQWLIH